LTESALSISGSGDMARVFAALGDPVRLRLFSLVATGGEVCSCNLEEPLGRSQPTVSHHTRVLVEAGLIVGDKRGRWTWWRVVPPSVAGAARASRWDVRTTLHSFVQGVRRIAPGRSARWRSTGWSGGTWGNGWATAG